MLTRTAEGWKIRSDSYNNEVTSAYPIGTDFDALIRDLPSRYEKWMEANAAQDLQLGARLNEFSVRGEPGHYPGLDQQAAAAYAHEHAGSGNYNPNFTAYRADCCNFYSQCIWAGFGGDGDDRTAIDGHDFPMLDGVPGATDWWGDSSDSSQTWRWLPSFLNMIIDNGNLDLLGPQGISLGSSPSRVVQGCAVVYGSNDHVYIVCHVNDLDGDGVTDFNEIWVCAHTEDRVHHRLSSIVDPTRCTYYRVVCYRVD